MAHRWEAVTPDRLRAPGEAVTGAVGGERRALEHGAVVGQGGLLGLALAYLLTSFSTSDLTTLPMWFTGSSSSSTTRFGRL